MFVALYVFFTCMMIAIILVYFVIVFSMYRFYGEQCSILWRECDSSPTSKASDTFINHPIFSYIALVELWVVCMIGIFTKLLLLCDVLVEFSHPWYLVNIMAFRPIIFIYLAMLQNYFIIDIAEKILSTKLNEPPGWIDVARFMLSGFLGPCSWWFLPETHPRPWYVVVFT